MERKRELKKEFRETRPDMGVFTIRSISSGKTYIEATVNLKSGVNRARFTLNFDSHMHKELQKDWKARGEKDFEIEILEILEYREDDPEGDYRKELDLLLSMWKERLLEEGAELY